MNNIFENFEKRFDFLTEEEKGILIDHSEIKQYAAGEVLINPGDINYNTFLVMQGILRAFYTNNDGVEITYFIADEGLNMGSESTFLFNKPSNETIMAIEDTVAIAFDTKKMEDISLNYVGICRAIRENYRENLIEAVQRLEFYTKMKPKERYFNLLETRPELIQRVPQKHLASYLGMKPESLSRIKKQKRNKK